MAKNKKAKGNTISVDMTGVEAGGKRIPEGEYEVEVAAVVAKESGEGKPYLNWELKIVDGKFKGTKLYHMTSLQPQALFNLRRTLEALGQEVPDGTLQLNLDEVIGLQMGVEVEHEEYNGKTQNRVTEVFSLEDSEESDSDDDSEDNDSEDDSDEDGFSEMTDEELIEKAKELEVEVPYSNKKKKKIDRDALIAALEEASEDDDSEEDDDSDDSDDDEDEDDLDDLSDEDLIAKAEEEEVEPVYSGKGKKKKLDREATIAAINEASEDDDEDEITEDDLKKMSDEELIAKAEEEDAEVVWANKKKKKLDRDATIENIVEALDL